jgi:hypothetical protein
VGTPIVRVWATQAVLFGSGGELCSLQLSLAWVVNSVARSSMPSDAVQGWASRGLATVFHWALEVCMFEEARSDEKVYHI